ncbi:uncharacterized protein LOC109710510 isoform X2 [Ananas comosus]|uniref:Uncharacterized protein LOC109710510 isoform X2 n=1 Tax=Ananas comosus TaxID=4615 RepID=A0A6P5EYV2_ANACO|nr:uncharacterized protein LOC109710510 isoform X2 [Ananas comosus]
MAGTLVPFRPQLYLRPPLHSRRVPSNHRSRVSAELGESSSPSSSSSLSTSSETLTISPPPGFQPPRPKRFSVRPDKLLDILAASLALPFRLGTGAFVLGYSVSFVSEDAIPSTEYAMRIGGLALKETSKLGPRPEKPIEIYEFESCPFCRKVDPNTGVAMYESDDIIKYLVNKYGDGTIPTMLSLGLLTTLTAGFAMIGRMGKGSSYTPSKLPPQPLELWAYEASPFCKIVREVLVELELPHILRSTARGSPKRQTLYEKVGHFQVPYLEDVNAGVKMFESAEIIDYLRATYVLS